MLFSSTLMVGIVTGMSGSVSAAEVPIRFRDSATGLVIRPEQVEARAVGSGDTRKWQRAELPAEGLTTFSLERGRQRLTATATGYRPLSGEVEAGESPFRIEYHLDPLELPIELRPQTLTALHRENETVFVGFIADAESGRPLAGVRVQAEPSGREARSDARGFFLIYVPVQTRADAMASAARLSFSAPGHRNLEHQYLELWSRGDWVYRISLERGGGKTIVDERQTRRRSTYPVVALDDVAQTDNARPTKSSGPGLPDPPVETDDGVETASVVPAIRVPTNIRVLRQDGVTIDYVSLQTYCQRSLPSEWIASWGSTGPGNSGTNCLLAGAVAVRTYAIGFVNNPANGNYDICGTTSCQVYNHLAGDSRTTAAVNATANYVMNQSGAARIGFKLTEYSAENNQLGAACGDGFTAPSGGCLSDPVCTGETTFGHGRGMCQWGTARWASGRKMANRTTGDTTTNGYPLQTWTWICEHYYPNLELVEGAPLVINDYVQVLGTSSLTVRRCADGSISTGTNCPQITTKPTGATGLIIGGPVRVTTDGVGYTWWQVQWFDSNSTIGWSPENWLERIAEPITVPPVLPPITNFVVNEGVLLSFTNSAVSSPNAETLLTDFESFANGTANGTVLFRHPTFSGSTSVFLDVSPSTTSVTNTFPAGNDSARALRANWSWNTTVNAWLRLTTSGTANLPNPVIDVTRKLKFDIYADRDLKIGIAVRETGNAAGTLIGSNGGTTPAIIEWAGVTNAVSGQPYPTRTVTASNWTTLVFDLPNEPVRSFFGGDGILSTTTGLGVLEHLAFVPVTGSGAYDVYLDNFIVSTPKILTYSLSNAPAGASINASNGVFTWTPGENQGPGVYNLTVIVTDNNLPPLKDTKTLQVTVNEVNQPPVLSPIVGRTVHAGMLLTFTNTATDPDVPANPLTYSLAVGATSGAAVGTNSGVFTWLTSDAQAGVSNYLTIVVADNGVPSLNDSESFSVVVLPRPTIQSVSVVGADFQLQWSAIAGVRYRVQFKNALDDANWTNLIPDVTGAGATASFSEPLGAGDRFYRVQVISP